MDYDHVVSEFGPTATARIAGAVLHRRGHYEETPDAFDWWIGDAANIARTLRDDTGDPAELVRAALVDTGLHDPTDPVEMACLTRDVEAVLDALGS